MLISTAQRGEAEGLARRLGYVELTGDTSFTPLFMKYLSFDESHSDT
jgi:hypothetical protein